MDFGAYNGILQRAAPCGGVVSQMMKIKLISCLKCYLKKPESRKKMFSEYGGTLSSYMEALKQLPAIVLAIDNYLAFCEIYPDQENDILNLSREGGQLWYLYDNNNGKYK